MRNVILVIALTALMAVNVLRAESPVTSTLQGGLRVYRAFCQVTVDFKARTMTVSSIGEFVTSRGEAIGKRTDVFSDIVIAEGDNGNVIISYVSKMFPDKKPVQLLKIATQESGSDGMSDRTYAAAAYTFLHERVELGGLKFCEVNGLTFLSELQPAELLEFVARSLLAGPRVGDQRLFQFCVMAGQEPTAFRYPSASTQAFWKFGLSFRVHPKIKTWLKISRYFRQIRLFWGIVVGRNT